MEDQPAQVFTTLNDLVLRQELIAQSHLACDTHWTVVKLGYPWSTLTKDQNRDTYRWSMPYGSAGIQIQAVPNKVWDLVNKTTESLLVDFPQVECEPIDDSDAAKNACDMANRFLAQDASEHGCNDAAVYADRIPRSLTTATSYMEVWVDPTGGGYIPLQIEAHPQAVSPDDPYVGPDGMPSADMIMRYVTAPQGGEFTNDPSQAAPEWQPALRIAKWQREHIRVFPETATVETAEKILILGYCTVGEARRRWPDVAQMDDATINALCDWTPPRYLVLLPPYQRARWKLTDGKDKNRQGSSDERILFYYHVYAKAGPDHHRGADVCVSGAVGGTLLGRALLAAEVEVEKAPDTAQQPAPMPSQAPGMAPQSAPTTKVKEMRCMEIPVIGLTLRCDPDEMDPQGRPYVEMFAGAAENNSALAMMFSEAMSKNLRRPFAIQSTSPITGEDVQQAEASGDMLVLNGPNDKPVQLDPYELPASFFSMYELTDEAINSIGSSERGAKGADTSKERSGKALELAAEQNNVNLTTMLTASNNSYCRLSRIKVEQVMAHFSTTQQVSYVGEDGAYKQDEWTGVDFALVGKVTIKAGTGTLLSPGRKTQFLANGIQAGIIDPAEGRDAVRSSFAKQLGMPDDPHVQRVERQIDAFMKGPPSAEWANQYLAWKGAMEQAQVQQQAAQQQAQAQTAATGVPAQLAPVAPPQIPEPWQPFDISPTDDEPQIATLRRIRIGKLIDEARFQAFPPAWRDTAIQSYQLARGAEAAAAQAAALAAHPMPAQPPQGQPGKPANEPTKQEGA